MRAHADRYITNTNVDTYQVDKLMKLSTKEARNNFIKGLAMTRTRDHRSYVQVVSQASAKDLSHACCDMYSWSTCFKLVSLPPMSLII